MLKRGVIITKRKVKAESIRVIKVESNRGKNVLRKNVPFFRIFYHKLHATALNTQHSCKNEKENYIFSI